MTDAFLQLFVDFLGKIRMAKVEQNIDPHPVVVVLGPKKQWTVIAKR